MDFIAIEPLDAAIAALACSSRDHLQHWDY